MSDDLRQSITPSWTKAKANQIAEIVEGIEPAQNELENTQKIEEPIEMFYSRNAKQEDEPLPEPTATQEPMAKVQPPQQ